jgi:hypothetical protein
MDTDGNKFKSVIKYAQFLYFSFQTSSNVLTTQWSGIPLMPAIDKIIKVMLLQLLLAPSARVTL